VKQFSLNFLTFADHNYVAGPGGLEPPTPGLEGFKKPPAGFLTTSSNREINWDEFKQYIYGHYSRRHAEDLYYYARKHYELLVKRDFSPLLRLSPNGRRHALLALSALSKFLGMYREFKSLRESYGIKWSSEENFIPPILGGNSFTRMLNEVRETIRALGEKWRIGMFLALSGLRVEEALEATRVYSLEKENYLNSELGVLEHFRFPNKFIRRTKKAFITVVDDYMLSLLDSIKPPSYNALRCYLKRHMGHSGHFRLFRKIWATYMRREGIDSEVIDLLQGRVSKTIFMRYYYRPDLRPLLEEVRVRLPSLSKILVGDDSSA